MMRVFSLYNKKAGYYNPPTFATGAVEDIKVGLTRYCITNPDKARDAHMDECDLYYLGDFNDVTADFQLLDKPEFVLNLEVYFHGND